jgi:hypothetical protein
MFGYFTMDSMFIVVTIVRANLGHEGYLGYFGYLGSLRNGYHDAIFTSITTVTLLISVSMFAYVKMIIIFRLTDKSYGKQPAGCAELHSWLG